MKSKAELTRAFAVRLDRCCRHRSKTLDELAREAGEKLGRRIRPEKLPTCVERPGWISLSATLAEVLDVDAAWLVFGPETSAPGPSWGTD